MKRQPSLTLPIDIKTVGKTTQSTSTSSIATETIKFLMAILTMLAIFSLLAILVDTPYPIPDENGGVTWQK